MGKDRFDFSEIDAALPAAERMQEKDRPVSYTHLTLPTN